MVRVIGGVLNAGAVFDLDGVFSGFSALSDVDPLDDVFSSLSADDRFVLSGRSDLEWDFFSSFRGVAADHALHVEPTSRCIFGRSFLDFASEGGVKGASGTAGGGGGGGATTLEPLVFLELFDFLSADMSMMPIISSSSSAGNAPGRSEARWLFFDERFSSTSSRCLSWSFLDAEALDVD
jgi:hypothetical protein